MTPSPPILPATHNARPQVHNAAAAGQTARCERARRTRTTPQPRAQSRRSRAPRPKGRRRTTVQHILLQAVSSLATQQQRSGAQPESSTARATQPKCLAPRPPRSSPRSRKMQHGTASTTGADGGSGRPRRCGPPPTSHGSGGGPEAPGCYSWLCVCVCLCVCGCVWEWVCGHGCGWRCVRAWAAACVLCAHPVMC
jgi:hypothetical protein